MMLEKYRLTKNGFIYGLLSGMTSTGLLYPSKFKPERYTRSYNCDLFTIGADMWRAFEIERNEKEIQTPEVRHSREDRTEFEELAPPDSSGNP